MSDVPVTAQQLAELRTELRAFIERADAVLTSAATKDDIVTEAKLRRRAIRRIVAVGLVAVVLVIGLFLAFRRYNDQKRADTAKVCITFANAHNGLVAGVEDMLRVAVAPSLDPRAQQFLQGQLASFETRRVNAADCTP